MYKKSYVCIVFIYAFIQTIHQNYTFFPVFIFIFPENVKKKKDSKYILKEMIAIWRCNSVAKSFLFNINLKLQKSDENWRRNKTLKSAHTIKKEMGEKRK